MEQNELLLRAIVGIVATFLICMIYYRAKMRTVVEAAKADYEARMKSQDEILKLKEAQLDEARRNQERVIEEQNRLRNERAMEQQRRTAVEDKLNETLRQREAQVAEFQTRHDKLADERNQLKGLVSAEQGRRAQFEEAIVEKDRRLGQLEQRVRELEEKSAEVTSLQERLKNREHQLGESKQVHARAFEELEKLKKDLMSEIARRSAAEERLNRIVSLEGQVRELDEKNTALVRENAELAKTRERLDKLEALKDVYAKTLEENMFLKQQNMARSFFEIRKGLEKAVQAYNQTFGHFDQRVLYTTGQVVEQLDDGRSGELKIADTRARAEETAPLSPIEPVVSGTAVAQHAAADGGLPEVIEPSERNDGFVSPGTIPAPAPSDEPPNQLNEPAADE